MKPKLEPKGSKSEPKRSNLSSAALGSLGALLGGVLGRSWAALGVSGLDLGSSWAALVAILERSWRPWEAQERQKEPKRRGKRGKMKRN